MGVVGKPVTFLHSMNLRSDVYGFVFKACQPSERAGAMASMLSRSFDV